MTAPFEPIVKNPHLLTIAGNYWRRNLDTVRFPVTEKYYETEPGVQVLVHSQRPEGEARGQLVLVHGLEGSSAAGYACSLAQAALEAGFAVHRFNMRSCGGTEGVCGDRLYHSGQTSDVLAVIRELRTASAIPIYPIGFSLGGNVVLKMAGELGEQARDLIAGVCAVSTPIDLAACVRLLKRTQNWIYARRFLSRLKERIRKKAALSPGLFDLSRLDEVNSIYDFDDKFTAPAFGFGTADNYYATQSAQRFLDDIRVDTLIVQAKDDPLIPFEIFNHPAFSRNPRLKLIAPDHGGHLGFIAKHGQRFWLDGVLLRWVEVTGNKLQPSVVL